MNYIKIIKDCSYDCHHFAPCYRKGRSYLTPCCKNRHLLGYFWTKASSAFTLFYLLPGKMEYQINDSPKYFNNNHHFFVLKNQIHHQSLAHLKISCITRQKKKHKHLNQQPKQCNILFKDLWPMDIYNGLCRVNRSLSLIAFNLSLTNVEKTAIHLPVHLILTNQQRTNMHWV
jgi:hypothetical protein